AALADLAVPGSRQDVTGGTWRYESRRSSRPWASTRSMWAAEHAVLTWTEHVRARMPVGDESAQLESPPGVPLLVVLRLCHVHPQQATRTLSLEEARHRADPMNGAGNLFPCQEIAGSWYVSIPGL